MIKFLDLFKQDQNLHRFILKKINTLFKKGDYILGKEVKIFENNFRFIASQNINIFKIIPA